VISCIFVVIAIAVSITALCALFTPDSRFMWYATGAMHAALVGTLLYWLQIGFLLNEPDGMRQLRGAYGEENTTDELKVAKRRRLIWSWVDSISLERGDLDHVVVTRRGGVLVLDSKWRNQTSVNDTEAMAAAASRMKRRADAVTRSLFKSERRALHRAKVNPVGVRPVVVLWGAEQHRIPDGVAQVNGIDFVAGRHLRAWLERLSGDPVSEDAAANLHARLLEFRASSAGRKAAARS
jgi:hypothetical protein